MVGIYQINRFCCLLMCLFFLHETKTFANEPTARHAIAMHVAPKYPINFQHFEYVNPNAPKGGAVVNEATGTFYSFNAFSEQTVEEIIKERKSIFSKNYKTAKRVQGLASNGNLDEAKKLMIEMSDNYTRLLDLFPENSKVGFKTEALPAIW